MRSTCNIRADEINRNFLINGDDMIAQETIGQLQSISVGERLHLMEILLNSLRQDIKNMERKVQPELERFTVRTFDLGQEIHADRDVIYAERGF
jgi:hypothetical protein